MKPSYDFHQRGPFVLPDTPGGRRIIRRAMRERDDLRWPASTSAGLVAHGRIPVFVGYTISGGYSTGFADDALNLHVPYSRVNVFASTGNNPHTNDDAIRAWREWSDCYEAANNPLFRFTKEDKATIKTMRVAIDRERKLAPARINDAKLDQFRAVNPQALLLILCRLSFDRADHNVVVKAFPYLRCWSRPKRARLFKKLVDQDSEASEWLQELETHKYWIVESDDNPRIRQSSSVFRFVSDKIRWLLSPAGLDAVRADVEKLPRISVKKSNRGKRAPSRRSQLLALGIVA